MKQMIGWSDSSSLYLGVHVVVVTWSDVVRLAIGSACSDFDPFSYFLVGGRGKRVKLCTGCHVRTSPMKKRAGQQLAYLCDMVRHLE